MFVLFLSVRSSVRLHAPASSRLPTLRLLTPLCAPLPTTNNPNQQETHGSKMAFLDGAPPERLCQPLVDHFTARGGELRMNARLKTIELNDDGSVKCLELVGGEKVEADLYISAMPGASRRKGEEAGEGGGAQTRRWEGRGASQHADHAHRANAPHSSRQRQPS